MNEDELVVAATFSFPLEAEIARGKLEAEGINAFIADIHTINMQWLYSNAMGGVRIQVAAKDLAKARQILNTDYSELINEEIEREESCSNCKGKLEPYTKGKKPAYLVFLLLGFPLFFYQHGLRCSQCGKFFKNTD